MGNGSSSEIQDELSKMELRTKFANSLKSCDPNKTFYTPKDLINKSSDLKNNIKKFAIFTRGESEKFHYWVTKDLMVIAFSVPFTPFPYGRFAIHKFLGEKFISIFLIPTYYSYMIYFMDKVTNILQKPEFLDHIIKISKNIPVDDELNRIIYNSRIQIPNDFVLPMAQPCSISPFNISESSESSEEKVHLSSEKASDKKEVLSENSSKDAYSSNESYSSDYSEEEDQFSYRQQPRLRIPPGAYRRFVNRARRTSQYSYASSVTSSSSVINSISEPPDNESDISLKYQNAKNDLTSNLVIRFSSDEEVEYSDTQSDIIVKSSSPKQKSPTNKSPFISSNPRLGKAKSSNLPKANQYQSYSEYDSTSDQILDTKKVFKGKEINLDADDRSSSPSRKHEDNSIRLKSRKRDDHSSIAEYSSVDSRFISNQESDYSNALSSSKHKNDLNRLIISSDHRLDFSAENPPPKVKSPGDYSEPEDLEFNTSNVQSDTYESSGSYHSRHSKSNRSHISNSNSIKSHHGHNSDKQSVKSNRSQLSDKHSVKSNRSHVSDKQSVASNRSHVSDKQSVKSNRSNASDKHSVKSNRSHVSDKQSVASNRSQLSDKHSVKSNRSQLSDKHSVKSNRSQLSDKQSVKSNRSHVSDKHSVKSYSSRHKQEPHTIDHEYSSGEKNYSAGHKSQSSRQYSDVEQNKNLSSSYSRSNRSRSKLSHSSRGHQKNMTDQNLTDNDIESSGNNSISDQKIESNFELDTFSARSIPQNKNTLFLDSGFSSKGSRSNHERTISESGSMIDSIDEQT